VAGRLGTKKTTLSASSESSARARRNQFRAVPGGGGTAKAPASDEQLIEAVRRGDTRVADELYDRLVGVVDRTLFRVFGRREMDHDDLVQISFERVVETLSTEAFARACSLETWAASIASHVGLNALRSRRRERRWLDRDTDGAAMSERKPTMEAERNLEARSRLALVRQHLVAMKPALAEAIFLHDALGHDLAEIALMTGTSVAAAQSRLVRGRKELFRRLDRADRSTKMGRKS
jgi:RNA polymerase sigma-70 factor (ECF subfamily)